MPPLHVLILERDSARRDELLGLLRGAGHRAAAAPDASAAAMAIGVPGFDTLVLDLAFPDVDLGLLRQALAPTGPVEPDSLEAAERRHIALTLRHTDGNKRRAAMLLGISRSTLLNKVRKYGLMVMLTLLATPASVWGREARTLPHGQAFAQRDLPVAASRDPDPSEPRHDDGAGEGPACEQEGGVGHAGGNAQW